MTGRTRALLILLILAGFALRVFLLGNQSFWYDEGVTATIAQRNLVELTRWTANDIQPPLYYYVVAGWGRVAGWSEGALRFPSAFFGVLAIPSLAVLALRLTHLNVAGWLVALLAVVHPLLVYYGQEARMYTLLVLLGILAAYLLVRTADQQPPGWAMWAAYVAVATAAIYTHYFAIFLLVGLGCAWLLDVRFGHFCHGYEGAPVDPHDGVQATWEVHVPVGTSARLREQRWREWLVPFAVANATVVLLYVPWLANLVTRLRVDRSYWTGTLKLHEALLDIALRFTSGETMAERAGLWLLIGYGAVTLVAGYGLWHWWPHTRRVVIYSSFWLVVPVLAVLLLAFNVPKFNARYVLLAAPGLLLAWAGGLAALSRLPRSSHAHERVGGHARRYSLRSVPVLRGAGSLWAAALCVSLLVAGGLLSNWNWFFNPAFEKDHWRQLTAFLRDRVAPDEQIVLVSGHAWPVWEYYAPDLPVVRLPDIEILDVDAVLDFDSSGPSLTAAFDESTAKRGAWLVNWQEEVVDPNDVAPVQLELGGREKGQNATFNGLTLRRYGGIRPTRFVTAPPVEHVLDAPFGDQLVLRGYKVLNNGDLLLFWQRMLGATAGSSDLHMSLATSTLDGQPIAHPTDRRLAGYTYPSFRWPADRVIMGHVPAREWLGDEPQPGLVQFTLRVYEGADAAATPLPTVGSEPELLVTPVEVVID
jgi:hypothetical protein